LSNRNNAKVARRAVETQLHTIICTCVQYNAARGIWPNSSASTEKACFLTDKQSGGALAHHYEKRRPLIIEPMKRYIILGALLVSATLAQAELGDTYRHECQLFGSRGGISKDFMYWVVPCPATNGTMASWTVLEQFDKNARSVCIINRWDGTGIISEQVLWSALSKNVPSGFIWTEYEDYIAGHRAFHAVNDTLIATLYDDNGASTLRITSKAWLKRHNLWIDYKSVPGQRNDDGTPPANNELPPVEEHAI
jgi:hypothetical protein